MKKMLSLEELLSNCFFPLFRSNLTAKFDKKQARFQETNRNLDSPDLLELSTESLITRIPFPIPVFLVL